MSELKTSAVEHNISEGASKLAQKLRDLAEYAEKYLRDTNSVNESTRIWWALKQAHTELDAARKHIYHLVDKYDKSVLPERFEAADLDMLRIPSIERSFYILPKFSVKMVDKARGLEWLRGHDMGDLITETVNAQTLANSIKQMVEEYNMEPPPDIFDVKTYYTMGSSKYKPKDK